MSESTTKPGMTREQVAAIELGQTDVEPRVAWGMLVVFLLVIVSVPVIQHVHEIRETGAPKAWNVFALEPTEKNFVAFERELDDESVVGNWLLPRVQNVLLGLGVGNEKAYVDGEWLFYRPGVDYVTGPGFLEPSVLRRRALGGKSWETPPQPDPGRAILDFSEQLRRRDITLILVPTPVKPESAVADRVTSGGKAPDGIAAGFNPSYDSWRRRVVEAGVMVVGDRLARAGGFLRTDTHWVPEWMDRITELVAVEVRGLMSAEGEVEYARGAEDVRNLGDIAKMLRLPEGQAHFEVESVSIRPVRNSDGTPWQPDPNAEILVLGDSFSNIYSLKGMGWGEHAGFVEQLSFHLQRPVDRISINDNGAFRTRQELRDQMRRGRDRLKGKKVVVWQFAARELAVGDWRMIDLPEVKQDDPLPERGRVTLRGRVAQRASPPRPGSVPYKDCLIAIELREVQVVEGEFDAGRALVFVWGMRDNVWTDAARWGDGAEVTLDLVPWEVVEAKYGGYNREELDDVELLDLAPWFGAPRE